MRRSRSRSALLPAALGAMAVVLAWRVLPYLSGPDLIERTHAAESKTVEQGAQGPEGQGPPALDLPGAERFALVIEHNLFSPARAPVTETGAEVEAIPDVPDLELVGVVLMDGGGQAILHPGNASAETLLLTLGAEYQGWTVTALSARSVTLSNGEDDVTYILDFTTRR